MTYQENRRTQSEITVQISSNDGWNSAVIEFKEAFSLNGNELLHCGLRITGNFWDRKQSLFPDWEAELTEDFVVHLPQIIFLEENLRKLSEYLRNWLANPFEFELELSGIRDPQLIIFVGQREDLISKPDHPVFALSYSTSRMKAEWSFVVDHSCISSMLDDLNSLLEKI
jgi:hypothetical protein